jgi:hypothetical protein
MSPNSFAPPTINASPINNTLFTIQPISMVLNTYDIDYTTTNWSFSVWGKPQFSYDSLTPEQDYITVLHSLSVPINSGSNNYFPDNTATNLTVGVLYNSGATTLVNDLIVFMTSEVQPGYAKWVWAINQDSNQVITGLNATKMWDVKNAGSTTNADKFTNIVISHDTPFNGFGPLDPASGSTQAYWNGQLLTLKEYVQPDSYPHIGAYASLDETRFYIASGSRMGMGPGVSPFLSTNTDNPTYYPLTILTQQDAIDLYNGGVVPPLIPSSISTGYIWNFDDLPNHIQCLDASDTPVNNFDLGTLDDPGNLITFTQI